MTQLPWLMLMTLVYFFDIMGNWMVTGNLDLSPFLDAHGNDIAFWWITLLRSIEVKMNL